MTTTRYVVEIETAQTMDEELIDTLLDKLVDHAPAAGRSAAGLPGITITIPADTLRAAATTALDLVTNHLTPLTVTAMPEEVRDAREDLAGTPEMLSVTEAADILRTHRTTVLRMIRRGTFPGATQIGNSWSIPRGAVAMSTPRPATTTIPRRAKNTAGDPS